MLYLKCKGQVMSVDVDERIADQYINANTVHFEFCERWNGMTITAQFTQTHKNEETGVEESKTYNKLIDEVTNTVILPNEIVAGKVEISAFGVHPTTGVRLTSIPVKKTVDKSGFVGDGEQSIPPTPDLYAQLLEKVNKTAIPHIGANGNWWFDDWDSGVAATAEVDAARQAAVNEINRAASNQMVEMDNKFNNTMKDIPETYTELDATVKSLKDTTSNIDETVSASFDVSRSHNLLDLSRMESGYINQVTGELMASATQTATDYLPISGDVLCFSESALTLDIGSIRYALYTEKKGFVTGAILGFNYTPDAETGRYFSIIDVPDEAKFIRVSATTDTIWKSGITFQLETGNAPSEYKPYGVSVILKDSAIPENVQLKENKVSKSMFATGDLANGEYLLLSGQTSLVKGESIMFACDIENFTGVSIGWTESTPDEMPGCYAEITPTDIKVYGRYYHGDYVATLNHGLTISTNLQFRISLNHDSFDVELISNGEKFEGVAPCYKAVQACAYVLSSGSELTNCKLSWCSSDINKKVWMFGDSYIGIANFERWAYYLQDAGFTENALIDARAGRNSTTAIKALNSLITLGKPDYIVWCMGMNDGSDYASSPSSVWTTGREGLLSICKEHGIVPIFATIPSVPSIDHTQKNAWIKSSGYRYVDFASAVRNDNGWHEGMLCADNVHPTEKGAKALYGRFLADFPEITIN